MTDSEAAKPQTQRSTGVMVLVWMLRIGLPVVIIFGGVIVARGIMAGKQAPERKAPPKPQPVVEVVVAQPHSHTVKVKSQGTVEARTTGTLQAEIAGKVVSISPSFRDGGFFTAGETLLTIDDREYRAQLAIAKAEIANAELALSQEQTRGKQARNDFKTLGSAKAPSTLALRKPQLQAAKADLSAARSRLVIAELAIERSRVVAPYNGRVVNQDVDVGQYITPATTLASVYATDAVEVRLSIADDQLRYLELPERVGDPQAAVTLRASVAGTVEEWQAKLVRTQGSIDAASRQRVAIAQIVDPFAEAGRSATPIKIGQFVEAEIDGRTFTNVYQLPVTAMLSENRDAVFVLDDEQLLEIAPVKVAWRGGEKVVVSSGLEPGQQVVVTAPAFGTEGMSVLLSGQKAGKKAEGKSKDRLNKPGGSKPVAATP